MPDPEKIGKYLILQRIGRGGMGFVYKAHDPVLKRDVAIKTMLREVSDDADLRSRFLREAQSAGGLRHPNIVTIYDLGEDNEGIPYIAMEFLTGTDLEHLIKNKVELPIQKKIDIVIQTCYGLGYAHANGIVHRDIKTANIRLLDNGEVKIMDFGIAKMTASHFTRTGMIMGTPHYMAPEQIRGEKVDGRADIFSLGVVLYELLTFRKPFPGDNPTTVLFKIVHENPEPLTDVSFTAPEGLEQAVFKALAKKSDERYASCEEFASDLLQAFHTLQQQEGAAAGGTPLPGSLGVYRTATPFPAMRKTGSVTGGTPLPKTPPPPIVSEATQLQPPAETSNPPDAEGTIAAAAPTRLQQPTMATVAQPPLAPPEPAPSGLPEITLTPVPSPARKWILVASSGVMGVAIMVALYFGFYHKEPKVGPIKPIEIPLKPPPKIEYGWASLNIQPWAEIKEIRDAKGHFVNLSATSTPCRLQLEPGKYTITFANSQFKPLSIEVEIKANQTTQIKRSLEGFDNAKAIDSLGL